MAERSPKYYQIKIKGHLDPNWAEWFDNMTIVHESEGTTTLSGPVVDQTALHGILLRIRNMNLTLISVGMDESKAKD